jgi:hypothetical protein
MKAAWSTAWIAGSALALCLLASAPDTAADWAGPDALVKRLNWARTTAGAAVVTDVNAVALSALGGRMGERTRSAVARAEDARNARPADPRTASTRFWYASSQAAIAAVKSPHARSTSAFSRSTGARCRPTGAARSASSITLRATSRSPSFREARAQSVRHSRASTPASAPSAARPSSASAATLAQSARCSAPG